MTEAILYFIFYFSVTVLIEALVVFIITRKAEFIYYSFLCNLLTNPALNYLLLLIVNIFGFQVYFPIFFVLEVAVTMIEAYIYQRISDHNFRQSLALSIIANLASLVSGFLINSLFM